MSIDKGDRVLINSPDTPYIHNRIATVTTSNRSGYYLQVDGLTPSVHVGNLQGMQCLDKLTSAQELALDLPSQVYDPASGWQDSPKSIPIVQKFSKKDTPEPQTMETSNKRKRGRPRKSISSPPALPASPLVSKEAASDSKTPEIVYPSSKTSLNKLTPRTGRSKTSPVYSVSIEETISDQSSTGLTSAGTMSNGSLLAADTLAAPIVDKDFSFLESPGGLGSGILGNSPPGQNRLEGQLKEIGSIGSKEVSNPEFLEASMGIPVGWTDLQDDRTGTELLAVTAQLENAAKPLETSLIPESPSLRSIASSTTPKQLNLTTKDLWVSPDQLEEVSYTQIRESVDSEAIARYAELMTEEMWDFQRQPLPVLFEHENRYLIGDGHHRIEAARKVGCDIKCEIFTAYSIEEALLYSIKAVENSNHGLPLRPKDQRKRIGMFLDLLERNIPIALPEGYQEWSSRAIATYLRLPESGYRTVATIRKERTAPEGEHWLYGKPTPPPTKAPAVTSTPLPTEKLAITITPLPTETPAVTPTPLPTETPADTITSLPTETPTTPNLSMNDRRLAGLVAAVSNQVEDLSDALLQTLRDAIEAEEVRRLEEREKGSH